jgi:hypothetical protein
LDEIVGIDDLERAALEFARSAPGELVGAAVESMIEELVTEVCGPLGLPIDDDDQRTAPWVCPKCESTRGFRRRGSQVRSRKLTSQVGVIRIAGKMVYCRGCDTRFAPLGQLLGLSRGQRRTEGLSTATAALAVEVAYAKASRLMGEIGGVSVSARTIRRDLIAGASERLVPRAGIGQVPVVLFDGTGERAGPTKGGVALHLAIGVVSRRKTGKKTVCRVELLGATLGEPWPVLFDLVADITPGLIVVDGEEELSTLCAERFAGVPRQRCLWHLARALVRLLRYTDRVSDRTCDQAAVALDELLRDAWDDQNIVNAAARLTGLADTLDEKGGHAAAVHLRNAASEIFTFLTNPDAGWLVAGHKGRPDVGTGVLERVMREMNRRSDIGVRWSIPGIRAILMTKLEHKYRHGRWSETETADNPTTVRISLQPPALPTAA